MIGVPSEHNPLRVRSVSGEILAAILAGMVTPTPETDSLRRAIEDELTRRGYGPDIEFYRDLYRPEPDSAAMSK